MKKNSGQEFEDALNYGLLIEALFNKKDLTNSQIIKLFKFAKKRNSDIEKDVKNWKPVL